MVTNEKIITINRPVDEVFAYVGDAQNGPKWQPALVEVRRITDGPLGIGTQYSGVRKFMGLTITMILIPQGFLRMLSPVLRRTFQRGEEKNLASIKAHMEGII